jgi:ABC-type dipeptide/oligopeptide/nickel transport system ATPase component
MPLLRLENLAIRFPLQRNVWLAALDGVNLSIRAGETHGLVGESGSGKTVAALAAIGLLDTSADVSGKIHWEGRELDPARPAQWGPIRGRGLTMMFQDSRGSLNPARTIGAQLASVLRLHSDGIHVDIDEASRDLLARVRLSDPARIMRSHPRELSGGMAQRAALALALACRPRLLIADEPTASLDATVAVAMVALLREVQKQTGLAMLVISHDMNVVRALCDRMSIMAEGRIIEDGSTSEILRNPQHKLTQALIAASQWKVPGDSGLIT